MPDSHEEQLLSDLLGRIAREDAQLDAAHLETRVMEAVEVPAHATRVGGGTYLRAAAIVMAVLVPGIMWITSAHPTPSTLPTLPTPPTLPTLPTPPTPPTLPTLPTLSTLSTPPTRPTPTTLPPEVLSAEEFVPLLPLTERELTGSFQLVRVQMPRASLGALRSPLEPPDELVEADVLLGADGMARAIRVSTSGSVYPWRTR